MICCIVGFNLWQTFSCIYIFCAVSLMTVFLKLQNSIYISIENESCTINPAILFIQQNFYNSNYRVIRNFSNSYQFLRPFALQALVSTIQILTFRNFANCPLQIEIHKKIFVSKFFEFGIFILFAVGNLNRKRAKYSEFLDLEECLLNWFRQCRDNIINMGVMILKDKDEFLCHVVGTFSASNGWLDKCKKEKNLAFRNICGESTCIN